MSSVMQNMLRVERENARIELEDAIEELVRELKYTSEADEDGEPYYTCADVDRIKGRIDDALREVLGD